MNADSADSNQPIYDVAIVGMDCRFPGAADIAQFWQNLRNGVESVTFFSDETLLEAGISPRLLDLPNYVKANAMLDDVDCFDAAFFGITPRDAEVMDPQQRLFLECSWHALEHAAYDPERYDGRISVYAGVSANYYLLNNLLPSLARLNMVNYLQLLITNDKDFLATRVAYRLNLRGAGITVQTACSTSLVATHWACQSLLNHECDMALAGGVSAPTPQIRGYVHEEGGIPSPDGHCRAFDASAQGTVFGSGVGVVVLKRLTDAIADGDTIHALIKGSAINNDGARKVGYTAPSEEGQSEVIAEALAVAGVDPATISYVETHGTGTALGDPIEVAALTRVFRTFTDKVGFCGLGSVKTNVGHLDAAAGVAGLIKTVLALEHGEIPPSLHFTEPNPELNLTDSPFYVNANLREWKADGHPLRAGVSSFGIGGTNAHVVLEQATATPTPDASRDEHLLLLSARSQEALEDITADLAAHLKRHPDLCLADVAYTLQVGRASLPHRRILVCESVGDAASALDSVNPRRILSAFEKPRHRPLIFMFPGQGAQYVDMGRGLYASEPLFRSTVDRCAAVLEPHLELDVRQLIYPRPADEDTAAEKLRQTSIAQPAIFVIEYALALLWQSWGLSPDAFIGHSIGEYTAACLAGVLSLDDALALVAHRGRLIQQLPGGSMLSVHLPEEEVVPLLGADIALAAANAPSLCTVSGPDEHVDALQQQLESQNVRCRRLHTSHAFHSPAMDPILDEFRAAAGRISLHPPQTPFISNVTGSWITGEQASDPDYWTRHLRHTVRFADGLSALLDQEDQVLLEVGPGRTLTSLAKQQQATSAIPSLRHPRDTHVEDRAFLLTALGRLWLAGLEVDWPALYRDESRRRLPLPTYPFARTRFWIAPPTAGDAPPPGSLAKQPDVADWFHLPSWKQSALPSFPAPSAGLSPWLLFCDELGLGAELAHRLGNLGHRAVTVIPADGFSQVDDSSFTLNPRRREDYDALFADLRDLDAMPHSIVHLWNVTADERQSLTLDALDDSLDLSFYSPLFLAQAIGSTDLPSDHAIHVTLLSDSLFDVRGDEPIAPLKAPLLGLCRVIPQEYAGLTCSAVDVLPARSPAADEQLPDAILAELLASPSHPVVAYRGKHRWVQSFEPVRLCEADQPPAILREQGVYLITGGLGGIGLAVADYLARTVNARLVLTARTPFPPPDQWQSWLDSHDESDPTSLKISRVKTIHENGAETLILSADVSDLEQMQSAAARAHQRFGAIHGVIHAAGVAGGGVIQLKTPQVADAVLLPKIKGTVVLQHALQEEELDFCLLFSSLASSLGGVGQVDYAAANAFLDACAHLLSPGSPTLTINWDTWQEVGMAVDTDVPPELRQLRDESLRLGMHPSEGVDVFCRFLSSGLSHVLVSTQDLSTRLRQNLSLTTSNVLEELAKAPGTRPAHPRPPLENPYVAPSNDVERAIAEVWQECLGIEQVGVYDNFFDLGGHSLLLLQIQSRLQTIFERDINPVRLFEFPAIHDLAEHLAQSQLQAPAITQVTDRGQAQRAARQQRRRKRQGTVQTEGET